MAEAVLPQGPLASQIVSNNVAVVVFAAGAVFRNADVVNPPTATEPLYIDIVTTALAGSATSVPIQPGGSYRISGPITTAISAVAATAGHTFVAFTY